MGKKGSPYIQSRLVFGLIRCFYRHKTAPNDVRILFLICSTELYKRNTRSNDGDDDDEEDVGSDDDDDATAKLGDTTATVPNKSSSFTVFKPHVAIVFAVIDVCLFTVGWV